MCECFLIKKRNANEPNCCLPQLYTYIEYSFPQDVDQLTYNEYSFPQDVDQLTYIEYSFPQDVDQLTYIDYSFLKVVG